MSLIESTFEIERIGDTLVITPTINLGELVYEQIESGANAILELLNEPTTPNVVMDFSRTDYFGTTALGFFVKLWKRVRDHDGRMAFCNTSDHEKEILQLTRLDGLWPLCESREDALDSVHR